MNSKIRKISSLKLVVSIVLLTTICSPAYLMASDGAVNLSFKISSKADKIVIVSREKICTSPWQGEKFSSEIKSKKYVARKSFKTGDNEITTRFKTTKIKLSVNGKEVPPIQSLKKTEVKTDKSGNRLLTQEAEGSFVPDLSLTLPEKAVKPGDKWTKIIKATKAYPASLKVEYELLGIKNVKKRKCAIIKVKCLSDELFTKRYAKVHLLIRNRIYFDIEAGKVIKNSSQSEFVLTWLKPIKGLPMQRATFSTTSMTVEN